MAVPLSIPLILTLITGIDSINTVSEVSVKAGTSISIPCLYSQQYKNHVKYLCEGYSWCSCLESVTTNSKHDTEKYSISEDKNQLIFTVTIKQLTDQNAYYWCAVEIYQSVDDGSYFHLSVTPGTPSLYVDNQKKTGFIGENITINCHYTTSGEMKWCKLNRNCVTVGSGIIDGTRVNLNSGDNRFTVTLSGLSPVSSGWYYCVKGDFQMPVHLTVTERPGATPSGSRFVDKQKETGFVGENITINCHYTTSGEMKWCKVNSSCVTNGSGLIDGTKVTLNRNIKNVFSVTLSGLSAESSGRYYCWKGDFQMPVHLTVTEKPRATPSLYVDNQKETGFVGENITINCHYTTSGEMKWCKVNSSCVTNGSGLIDGTKVTLNRNIKNVFSVTLSGLSAESSGRYYCDKGDFQMSVHLTVTEKPAPTSSTLTEGEGNEEEQHRASVHRNSFLIRLSLLILFGIVVLLLWLILRMKETKQM